VGSGPLSTRWLLDCPFSGENRSRIPDGFHCESIYPEGFVAILLVVATPRTRTVYILRWSAAVAGDGTQEFSLLSPLECPVIQDPGRFASQFTRLW
jgi:hypothetical protein